MGNDKELKTHVDEDLYDEVIFIARALGFENKSQYLRALIQRDIYGVSRQVKSSAASAAMLGPVRG